MSEWKEIAKEAMPTIEWERPKYLAVSAEIQAGVQRMAEEIARLRDSIQRDISDDWYENKFLRQQLAAVEKERDELKDNERVTHELFEALRKDHEVLQVNLAAAEKELLTLVDSSRSLVVERDAARAGWKVDADLLGKTHFDLMAARAENARLLSIVELCKEEIDHGFDLPSEVFDAVEKYYASSPDASRDLAVIKQAMEALDVFSDQDRYTGKTWPNPKIAADALAALKERFGG